MARFDCTLVSPTSAQLAAELARATAHANDGMTLLHVGREQYDGFLERHAGQPEGLRQWSDSERGHTARVAVAWWTDHVGRKHFRLQAGNSRDGSYRSLSSSRTDPRPALWHVYPEQTFYRERGLDHGWRVVCGCGLCDTPARLGWMGTRCGPCHDRTQEGGEPPPAPPCPTFRDPPWRPTAVAFSPDARRLAVARVNGALGGVRLHDLHDGGGADVEVPGRPERLAFSPNGRLLAVSVGPGSWSGVFDPATGTFAPPEGGAPDYWLGVYDLAAAAWAMEEVSESPIWSLAFGPAGPRLAVGRGHRLEQWERRGRPWHRCWVLDGEAAAVAYAPGGDVLAAETAAGLTLIDAATGVPLDTARRPADEHPVTCGLAFPARDRLVALCAAATPSWLYGLAEGHRGTRAHGLRVRHYAAGPTALQLRHTRDVSAGEPAALSPDGRWAAGVTTLGPRRCLVAVADAATGREVGRVGWDLDEPLTAVVFSADGHTLAALSEPHTAKVIPWRLLLEP